MENYEKEIDELKDWKKIDNKIYKKFTFKDFVEAFGFITKIALESEKMDHHPDITISYNNVEIQLTTHKINNISKNDILLARKIDGLL